MEQKSPYRDEGGVLFHATAPHRTPPMPEAIRHPVTGDPIELGPDERLCRVAGSGPVVLAVVATRPTHRAPRGAGRPFIPIAVEDCVSAPIADLSRK